MRRAIGDAVLTAGGAMLLVLALVMFDDRVRDQITGVFDARHPRDAIVGLSGRATAAGASSRCTSRGCASTRARTAAKPSR